MSESVQPVFRAVVQCADLLVGSTIGGGFLRIVFGGKLAGTLQVTAANRGIVSIIR